MEVTEGGLSGQACACGETWGTDQMSALPIKLALFPNAVNNGGRGIGKLESLSVLHLVQPLWPDNRLQYPGGVLAIANPGIRSADGRDQWVSSKVFQ